MPRSKRNSPHRAARRKKVDVESMTEEEKEELRQALISRAKAGQKRTRTTYPLHLAKLAKLKEASENSQE